MNISILVEKIFIRSFLIVTFFVLQSCSNTLIGEKLESSFDIIESPKTSEKTNNKPKKTKEKTKIKSIIKDDKKENKNIFDNIVKENSISNKDRLSKKSIKPKKKTIFNPQPYRIILRLSGANPSAPAETVTEALRTAGVQFEVEKIERFDEEKLLKDPSFKR
ncbi:hypothetical protein [Prochlorococcus sp. MIT 0801]|uniref:hypothetical protein n=1 Tax=Prochlorococcus sp. MIT 0801 TaxID=1501269 RepID=UPI0004F83D98|nr:hypothetical protein [Prochlorococcus sp. MIT 0801]AIQ96613.1 hypothetical protein EW15_0521 [Prochlorococcus sp. MIT 0801]